MDMWMEEQRDRQAASSWRLVASHRGEKETDRALVGLTPAKHTHTHSHSHTLTPHEQRQRYIIKRIKTKGQMYKRCMSEEGGRERAGTASPQQAWPPSSAYQLQPPGKQGWAARKLWLGPGVGGWRSELLCPAGERWPESENPWAVGMGQGRFSSRWQESHRPPGTSPCGAGPLVAGPHC